ncbi:MAG TPA: hypothetical protein VGL37_02820 [Solirubrobacteraceae bacterium]
MRFFISRVLAVWLVLAAAATLAAGCAGNTASASDATSRQARVRAFAAEVNLHASDLPGFKIVAGAMGEPGALPSPLPREAEVCDGGPLINGARRGVASAVFQQQHAPIQTVVSAVYPTRDPSVASTYIAAADSASGRRCIQREEIRRSDAARVQRKSEVVALDQPAADAPVSGARVWRCLVSDHACNGSPVRSFTDRLWFAAGRYVVVLVYIAGPRNEAKGPESLALPLERRLIARLYRRAQAHKP